MAKVVERCYIYWVQDGSLFNFTNFVQNFLYSLIKVNLDKFVHCTVSYAPLKETTGLNFASHNGVVHIYSGVHL